MNLPLQKETPPTKTVLVLENDDFYAGLLLSLIKDLDWESVWVKTVKEAKEAINQKTFEVAIIDYNLDEGEFGTEVLEFFEKQKVTTKAYLHSNNHPGPFIPERWAKNFIPKPMGHEKIEALLGVPKKNIFVVDDSELALTYIDNLITEYGDIKSSLKLKTHLFNEAQAEGILHFEHRPSLLIIDYRIGSKSGLDLYSEFKKLFPECSTYLLTNDISEELQEEALALGIKDVFEPPLTVTHLESIFSKLKK